MAIASLLERPKSLLQQISSKDANREKSLSSPGSVSPLSSSSSSSFSPNSISQSSTPSLSPAISHPHSRISSISSCEYSQSDSSSSSSSSSSKSRPQSYSGNDLRDAEDHKTLPHDIFTITDDVLASQYNFEEEIGYGNWGSIWRVTDLHRRTGSSRSKGDRSENNLPQSNTLAVKLVYRDKSSGTTAAKIKSLWSEFKILRQFKNNPHKNVLKTSSFIITPSYALLTMCYCPGALPVKLGESSSRSLRYIKGLLSGTDFLHRHGITHNDLKPANIVLSAEDQPVLIDFGFAVDYRSACEHDPDKPPFWSSLSWGTPEYLAPQRARGEWHDERLSDIWSLGVTIYEIVVGRTPFEANETEEFLTKASLEVYYQRTLKAEFLGPHKLSSDLRDLVESMLRPNPDERLGSCAEALRHRYILRPLKNLEAQRYREISKTVSLKSRPAPLTFNKPSGKTVGPTNHRSTEVGFKSPSVTRIPKAIYEELPTTPKPNLRALRNEKTSTTPRPAHRIALKEKSLNTPEIKKLAAEKSGQVVIKHKRVPVPKFDSTKENEPIQRIDKKDAVKA
ncbi:kinase-like domain-containing protein [Phakopsora pachyrhizi]|nr:kinase-like domain-containing protein [Phakopsora pachyrhizi]